MFEAVLMTSLPFQPERGLSYMDKTSSLLALNDKTLVTTKIYNFRFSIILSKY